MELVKYELQVPKEFKEVVDFFDKIYSRARDGVQIDDITALLPDMMQAIQGLENVDDEVKSVHGHHAITYLFERLGTRFLPAKREQVK